MPIQASGWWVEKGLAMVALPFVRHSTMALAPMVTQASSPRLSSLWSSLLQEMLLHSQQLSPPWVCSPNPTFQHPALLCTRRHTTQAGVCRGAARTMSTVLCPAFHRPVVVFPAVCGAQARGAPAPHPETRARQGCPPRRRALSPACRWLPEPAQNE